MRTMRLLSCAIVLTAITGLIAGCAQSGSPSTSAASDTTQPIQSTYASADDAVTALIIALRANDSAQLKLIFGPGSEDLLSSGDAVADQDQITKFLAEYDQKHSLAPDANGNMTLTVGDTDWPLPIPVVQSNGVWSFDTDAGKDEILNRRIGRNELAVIQVCKAVVDAQNDYVRQNPMGDTVPAYAQKFLSDSGTKDGLYWPSADGEPVSPLGPLMSTATEEGYTFHQPTAGNPQPYQGYFYRMLKSQGPNATGGAFDYMVNDKMVGGFAAVAYPAQYGNSGVMTFITNYQGVVYQKDLGPDTAALAKAMTQFDPDSTWTKVQ